MLVPKTRKFADALLIFAIVYLGLQFVQRMYFPKPPADGQVQTSITLRAQDATVKSGHHPVLLLRNSTEHPLSISTRCPEAPVDVYFGEGVVQKDASALVPTEVISIPCETLTDIASGKEGTIDLGPWKYSAFDQIGNYTVVLTLPPQTATQTGTVLETSFTVYPAGWMTRVFRAFVSKPLLNLLVFIASVSPGYSLAVAIIVLTFIIKLLLFIPTQHGLEGQKKLQALQPKIDEIRKRYPGNAQKVNEETMKLWKENKINPFQSCLPIFIQFPILIGLFYAVRDGSHLGLSTHLLYAPYQNLPWTFGTWFFGMDLLKPSIYLFPPMLVALQFFQMKLTFAIAEKKKKAKEIVDISKPKEKKPMSQQDMQQKMMLYVLPFMIGFFAFKFPAAVSLYWAVSTVFAIGQQVVVNRKG
jgi:YidC/Oxa1 family membrane protein insertase